MKVTLAERGAGGGPAVGGGAGRTADTEVLTTRRLVRATSTFLAPTPRPGEVPARHARL